MSEEEKAKQDLIEAALSDDEYGYGSKTNTLKHARQMHTNYYIWYKWIYEVSCRNKKVFRNYNSFIVNYNSFIVNFPRNQFMVDIAEMSSFNGEHKYLVTCIDIFSKYAYAIEMHNKNPTQAHLY